MVSGVFTENSFSFLSKIAEIYENFNIFLKLFSQFILRNEEMITKNEENFLKLLKEFSKALASLRQNKNAKFPFDGEKVAEEILLLNQSIKISLKNAAEIRCIFGKMMAGAISLIPDINIRRECRERALLATEKEVFTKISKIEFFYKKGK